MTIGRKALANCRNVMTVGRKALSQFRIHFYGFFLVCVYMMGNGRDEDDCFSIALLITYDVILNCSFS